MKILLCAILLLTTGAALAVGTAAPTPGFLVAAPDRGFAGNEEIRDAFAAFSDHRTAELVFITDARSRPMLGRAVTALQQRGATEVVVLPVFLSVAETHYRRLREQLASLANTEPCPPPVTVTAPFGTGYLAIEELTDRLRTAVDAGTTRFLIVGQDQDDASQTEILASELESDLGHLARQASAALPGTEVAVHVWREVASDATHARSPSPQTAFSDALVAHPDAAVVPLHLGRRLDRMMAFDSELRALVPPDRQFIAGSAFSSQTLAQWLMQTAGRHVPLEDHQIGVVVLAHGADWHWNETLRKTVRPLESRYLIEYAFSMADQQSIERAVGRLEGRGAKAVVVVRVFGLAESFRAGVERMLGMDIDRGGPTERATTSGHHQHLGQEQLALEPRIRATIPMTTVGGLEDAPQFARALLDRARALGVAPARETIVLVGHGAEDDSADLQWNRVLESLARQMRALGGSDFRAIHSATWREDWPELRGAAVARVRGLVSAAATNHGRALVIPARSNGQGPEADLLAGLSYQLGEGFAPHPLFRSWLVEQVGRGISQLRGSRVTGVTSATATRSAPPESSRHPAPVRQ